MFTISIAIVMPILGATTLNSSDRLHSPRDLKIQRKYQQHLTTSILSMGPYNGGLQYEQGDGVYFPHEVVPQL